MWTTEEYRLNLSKDSIESLIETYVDYVSQINHTIGQIAIGYATDNGTLIEYENNPGYEHAYEYVTDLEEAMKLKGYDIKPAVFIDIPFKH